MAGSVPAAGISPIFSFNRTRGKKKTNRTETKCYFHTSLTSRLILSARHRLRVAFPAAFLPGVGPSRGCARGDRRSCQRQAGGSGRGGSSTRREQSIAGRAPLSWGAPRVPPLHRDPQQVPWSGSIAGGPLRVSTSA